MGLWGGADDFDRWEHMFGGSEESGLQFRPGYRGGRFSAIVRYVEQVPPPVHLREELGLTAR